MSPVPIPAAEYVRMSTEHQQYSIANQQATIRLYAEQHGFEVIETYADAGKSGLVLRNRPALGKLIDDVVSGRARFRAVLVYDVSRWGRFQDTDEAAHYEFLCKSAKIPIHYCAEQFNNDGSLYSAVFKTLKRTMAAEYSRELGTKVYEGQKRIAQLGFHVGALPGYGLRRMLMSADGAVKQSLRSGDHKSLSTDRVVLVAGPLEELQVVRSIYAAALGGQQPGAITKKLNRDGIPYVDGKTWKHWNVIEILRNPKYAGCSTWGRTSQRLHGSTTRMPYDNWVKCAGAYAAIVAWNDFQRVQVLLDNKLLYSDEEMLSRLKQLVSRYGKVSQAVMSRSTIVPSASQYRRRFGTLQHAYELIGYEQQLGDFAPAEQRRHSEHLRDKVARRIADRCAERVAIVRRNLKCRPYLLVDGYIQVALLICPHLTTLTGLERWILYPQDGECSPVVVACALRNDNQRVAKLYLLPGKSKRTIIKGTADFVRLGLPINRLSRFPDVVLRMKEAIESTILL